MLLLRIQVAMACDASFIKGLRRASIQTALVLKRVGILQANRWCCKHRDCESNDTNRTERKDHRRTANSGPRGLDHDRRVAKGYCKDLAAQGPKTLSKRTKSDTQGSEAHKSDVLEFDCNPSGLNSPAFICGKTGD